MSANTATITLNVGNAVPHGNAARSKAVVGLWREIGGFFQEQPFVSCLIGQDKTQLGCKVSLDASAMVSLLEKAVDTSGSFDAWRQGHIADADNPIAGHMVLTITAEEAFSEWAGYQVASNFFQQLVLAANLVQPGSIQLLGTRFEGEGAYRYEMSEFDSHIFYDAGKFSQESQWPPAPPSGFYTAWRWLEKCGTSEMTTAFRDINKVLFSLLKVAQMRQEYSARTVLIVLYLLEVLLDCRNQSTCHIMRNRVMQILGSIPESGDRLRDLYEVKHKLYMGDQPVRRPDLLSHDMKQEMREELGQNFNAIEIGVAVALGLLHRLITENGTGFTFTESYSCS